MSRPQRVPNAPRLVHNLRSSLELSNCIFIDGALKDLKAASRRLRSACAALQDESRVLERLYYKGKNQHRSALFWRHVSEVRRYYRRLEELRLTRVVEDLRGSFFGDLAVHNSKVLKGSWTHYPNGTFVLYVSERLSTSVILVEKMQERLTGAHRCLTTSMQSGYFVQFLLTLIAIVSRMSVLLLEILEAVRANCAVCGRVLQAVGPSLPTMAVLKTDAEVGTSLPQAASGPTLDTDEDLGTSIMRSQHPPRLSPSLPLTMGISESFPDDNIANRRDIREINRCTERPDITSSDPRETSTAVLSSSLPDGKFRVHVVKKKGRRTGWDEIDEIFNL